MNTQTAAAREAARTGNGRFGMQPLAESGLILTPVSPAVPIRIDAEWLDRLAPHQQRDFLDDGTLTILDASGDPCTVTPGVIDDEADWVFKNGQCLALAVVLAEKTGGKVYCQRRDMGDVDEHGEKFYSLGHALVILPSGELLDIQGEHGGHEDIEDEYAVDNDTDAPIGPLTFDDPRDALTHFDGYLEDQDQVAAEPFAATVLAHHRLGTYTGAANYDALSPADAKALIDRDLINRYTLGDCGVLAHYLAERNGWGVCVVGDYEEEEIDGEETSYDVTRIQHAYAVRPDGALVDITGVYPPKTAYALSKSRRAGLHIYPDAASADKVWNHAQWMDEQVDFEDGYDEEGADSSDIAEHAAALVTIAYGR